MITAAEGYPYAFGPDSEEGALHKDTRVTLKWQAGDYALSRIRIV